MRHEKPPEVRQDMIQGNREILSRRGKKGNSHKIQLEDLRKAKLIEQEEEEKKEKEREERERAKLYSISEEGDVLPPVPPESQE